MSEKSYMERMIKEESDGDHNLERDAVEGSVDCVSRHKGVHALN